MFHSNNSNWLLLIHVVVYNKFNFKVISFVMRYKYEKCSHSVIIKLIFQLGARGDLEANCHRMENGNCYNKIVSHGHKLVPRFYTILFHLFIHMDHLY